MYNKLILFSSIGALFILFTFDFSLARAEEQIQDNMAIVREALQANKKLFIAENMDLTVRETNQFWELYDSYQNDLGRVTDRYVQLIDRYTKNYNTLSDEDALKLLNERLALDGEHQKLHEAYLPKFLKILPGKKVTRYYQLESKFSAVIRYDLAKKIPLVK